MTIKVCLDNETYTVKPQQEEMRSINNRIAQYPHEAELRDIAIKVSKGTAFTPAIFKSGRRKKDNVLEMQLFALDFDDGIPYQDIKKIFEHNDILIAFSYHSLSSKPDYQKFRIVLCHVVPIKEFWLMDMILEMLKRIFPMADSSCFERSRMFLGGKELIEINEENTFRIDKLVDSFQRYEFTREPHNCIANIRRIAEKAGIAMFKNKYMDIRTYENGVMHSPDDATFKENRFNNVNKYILSLNPNSLEKYPLVIFNRSLTPSVSVRNGKGEKRTLLQHVGVLTLYDMCRLFKAFSDNTDDLTHNEHLMLALNLMQMKGMKNVFFECLKHAGCDLEKWRYDWQFFIDHEYQPMRCEGNCRYSQECCHKLNLVLTVKERGRVIRRIAEPDYVSADESYRVMTEHLMKELRSSLSNELVLIPGQTGIGKTHAYLEALKRINTPVIIAVPTVELKHEIALKAGDLATELISLKDLMLPKGKMQEIKGMYDSGHYREARQMLRAYQNDLSDSHIASRDMIEQYLRGISVVEEKQGNVIMTHAQLIHAATESVEGYTVIVDEDILYTILRNTKSIRAPNVEKAIDSGLITGDLALQLRKLIASKNGTYVKLHNKESSPKYITVEEQSIGGCYGNINDLLSAGAACIDNGFIHYFTPCSIPYTKTIILSATMSEDLYRLYFSGRRIRKYNVPKARYMGELRQYTSHCMSRTEIDRLIQTHGSYRKLEEKIVATVDNHIYYEIGFKKYMEESGFDEKMNYGATSGIDKYKGENGLIIGTPHLDEKSYMLIGCYLEVDVSEDHLANRRITHKGYEFVLMTYELETLRILQLYFLDSELEQAIGRSRLLRENCNVYLFSNYPCEQAELIESDYLRDDETDMPQTDMPESQF